MIPTRMKVFICRVSPILLLLFGIILLLVSGPTTHTTATSGKVRHQLHKPMQPLQHQQPKQSQPQPKHRKQMEREDEIGQTMEEDIEHEVPQLQPGDEHDETEPDEALDEDETEDLPNHQDEHDDPDTQSNQNIPRSSPSQNTISILSNHHNPSNHPSNTTFPKIAYAISLVKCGDHQTTSAGLMDAALILRHSIHLISSRNPHSGSKYDYTMIAIVHRKAIRCSRVLRKVGFEILVVAPPVQPTEIQGEHLREHIHKEWCCGHGTCCCFVVGVVVVGGVNSFK